jgi:hypothetical protein
MNSQFAPHPALVIFVDHTECRWLRMLRAGFRHCFVVMRDGQVWFACDPLKNRIEISVLPVPEGFDLPGFYAARGHMVLLGAIRRDLLRRGFGIAPLTCVTVAKRLLGVRAPRVLTPWQLYWYLKAHGFHHVDVRSPPMRRATPRRADAIAT